VILEVSFQQIKFIERANFEHLENLKGLHLTENEIENLPEGVFWDLKNLVHLGLEYNKIEQLSDKIFVNLKNIESIGLSGNRIKHFPSNLLIENVKLEFFLTMENPENTSNIDISKIPNVNFRNY
jgi:Leucine-rich repeat (LRR) protein